MKIEYSKEADGIYVYFKEEYVAKSKDIEDGVVIDFDKNGQIIGASCKTPFFVIPATLLSGNLVLFK